MGCSGKVEYFPRELVVTASGILSAGTPAQFEKSNSASGQSYSVSLRKGEIEITDEILADPIRGSYDSSLGMFFKVVDEGVYTVIVKVFYHDQGIFGSRNYSGVAYTTIKYPDPVTSVRFTFDWSKGVSSYEENGITYTRLVPVRKDQ